MDSSALTVAVLGPKGQCGKCVVDELLERGHNFNGISWDPPKEWKTASPNSRGSYTAKLIDIQDTKGLAAAFSDGLDAVVAFAPPLSDLSELYELGVEGHRLTKTALLASGLESEIIIIDMKCPH
ncbi:nad-dependent epimerase dehydratase [Fusarium acutatum]|uniref:Nad-dependent epimerase dehydratase n=1 Tax=Fusarium acutatum TaxID=78861 RepID=A0A8H4NS12_9HYPO|nr:nad-dependent epimerase dehydratase [Fusarium acutatum]